MPVLIRCHHEPGCRRGIPQETVEGGYFGRLEDQVFKGSGSAPNTTATIPGSGLKVASKQAANALQEVGERRPRHARRSPTSWPAD